MGVAIFKRTMVKARHPEYGFRYYCMPCVRMLCPSDKLGYVLGGGGVMIPVGGVQERWELVQVKNQPCVSCQH